MSEESRKALRLWLELARAAMPMAREVDCRFRAEFGQSLVRFDVLSQLDRHPEGVPITRLASMLLASTSKNISMLIDRMIEEKLVEKRSDPDDRRRATIALTGHGRREFDRMAAAHEKWAGEMFGSLQAKEREALLSGLSAFNARHGAQS